MNKIRLRYLLPGFLLFFYLAIASYYYLLRERPTEGLPFVKGENKERLLASLQWYADHALGALSPNDVGMLFVTDTGEREKCENLCISGKKVLLSGGLFREEIPNKPGERRKLSISSEAKPYIWWPGVPHLATTFFYSPYDYKITSVDLAEHQAASGVETLKVTFRWKKTSSSVIQQYFVSLGLANESALNQQETQHQVTMVASMYGYFLPLTREPSYH